MSIVGTVRWDFVCECVPLGEVFTYFIADSNTNPDFFPHCGKSVGSQFTNRMANMDHPDPYPSSSKISLQFICSIKVYLQVHICETCDMSTDPCGSVSIYRIRKFVQKCGKCSFWPKNAIIRYGIFLMSNVCS